MNLISLAIRRPTAVAMFFLAVLFTGMVSLSRLPLDLTPDASFPKLSVVTHWPNTSPETIEALVTSPIEAAANTVAHVKRVDSISEEGRSTVNIEFARGADMDFAALELSEKLSLLKEELPFGVQPPQIQKYVPKEFQSGRFLSYHLTGPLSLPEIRRFALERLRGPLLAVEGVADVQVLGGQDSQLQIEIDPTKLSALGLSEQAVAAALRDVNVRAAAGQIHHGSTKFDLIIDNPLTRIDEISEMIVSANNGAVVRVRDVARVYSGYSEPRNLTRIDGQPAIVINIEKEAGANTILVADRIFVRLAELQKNFPSSVRQIKERDQSEQIRRELTNLASRSLFCVAVIFLVLLAFLRNVISPLIILATIFFSVLLTINFFYFAGIGLNLLTLAGLALGFGMMVDNSIVGAGQYFSLSRARR
jgi:HAE1 family hydrophobic/amphiphilic exporter-1